MHAVLMARRHTSNRSHFFIRGWNSIRIFQYFLILLTIWTISVFVYCVMVKGMDVMELLYWSRLTSANKARQVCIHPQLLINDSVMLRHYKAMGPEVCPKNTDWIQIINGTLLYNDWALANLDNISCTYIPIERDGDYQVKWGRPIMHIQSGFSIKDDFFRVFCTARNQPPYHGLFAGVAFTPEREKTEDVPMKEGLDGMSIAILGFDSMSRMSWLRRLQQTRSYFHEELGAIELEAHNIVGDGTTAVMLPMLTGKFEWELPEARRFFPNATTLDNFPFIWKKLKKFGYLTSWCNADNQSAPLNYRMLGFKDQPTDFYIRPFFMLAKPYEVYTTEESTGKRSRLRRVKTKKYCVGSRTYSQVWLNYFRDIFLMYPKKRKFLVHFLTDMSHDENNLITKMDDDIKNLVKFLFESGYLNNTLLILMGDHGARYDKARLTWVGKMEERLPYFSLLFPQWFQEKYPDAMRNLRTNRKRLTTPFDVYATFMDFIRYDGAGTGDIKQRGISLFKEIPMERSCLHADIANHWCACLASNQVSLMEDEYARQALHFAVATINGYTAAYRDLCAPLAVRQVMDVIRLETHNDVLRFSGTDGNGGIYNISFKAKNRNLMNVYQLTFDVTPGWGMFEVTVTHDLLRGNFKMSEKEVSRINRYGDTSACILDKNRQLRQFCYCKSIQIPWGLF